MFKIDVALVMTLVPLSDGSFAYVGRSPVEIARARNRCGTMAHWTVILGIAGKRWHDRTVVWGKVVVGTWRNWR